jgi:hypothetical protein
MNRIEPPAWAREPTVWLDQTYLADYLAIQEHRDKLLAAVHKEVEKYLNTRDLVYDDEEGFPNRSRMTGDYYIGSESYIGNNEGGWTKVGIECGCAARPGEGHTRPWEPIRRRSDPKIRGRGSPKRQ